MFLLVSLRAYVVGPDTVHYIEYFLDAIKDRHPTEPIWDAYVMVFRSLTDNPQLFLSFTAFITFVPLFVFFNKKSEYVLLSLFIYYILPNDQGFVFSMSGMRQALALSLVLWMFHAFENKKWKWVAVLVTTAFLIHNSSIIAFIGILIASYIKPNRAIATVLVIASVFIMGLSFSMKDVFSYIDSTSLMQLAFIEDYSSYATYLDNEYSISFWGVVNLVLPPIIMSTLIILNPKVHNTLYARLYLLGSFLLIIFSGVPMISRYFIYFIMAEVIILPQIYNSNEMKINKLLCNILLLYHSIILFRYLYFDYLHGLDYDIRRVSPYFFFFEDGFNHIY